MYRWERVTTTDAERRMTIAKAAVGGLLVLALVSALFSGCAQNTDTPVAQTQTQGTPVATDQKQATSGTDVGETYNITYVQNAPARGGMYENNKDGSSNLAAALAGEGGEGDAPTTVNGTGISGTDAGYVQYVVLNQNPNPVYTTGGTAPTLTGSATGAPVATGTQSATASPELRARGEVAATVPVGIAPGGIADVQGGAATRGNVDQQKTTDNRLARLEANQKVLAESLDKLVGFLTQPKGPPSGGDAPPPVTTNTPAEIPTTQESE